MREYEERRKAEDEKKEKARLEKEKAEEEKKKEAEKKDDKLPGQPKEASVIAPLMPAMMGMDPNGMMAGVAPPAPNAKPDEKKPNLPVTVWGRYIKVLLSSTEFMFIN